MTRIALITGIALAACGGGANTADTTSAAAPPAAATTPSDVDKALAVQRGIDANPTKVDSILSANGLTAAGFDSLMYQIAGDSAKRAAFSAGR